MGADPAIGKFVSRFMLGGMPAYYRGLKPGWHMAQHEYAARIKADLTTAIMATGELHAMYLLPSLYTYSSIAQYRSFWTIHAKRMGLLASAPPGSSASFYLDPKLTEDVIQSHYARLMRDWFEQVVRASPLLTGIQKESIELVLEKLVGAPITEMGAYEWLGQREPVAPEYALDLPEAAFGTLKPYSGIVGTGDGREKTFSPEVQIGGRSVSAWLSAGGTVFIDGRPVPKDAYTLRRGKIVFKTPPAKGAEVYFAGNYVSGLFQAKISELAPFYSGHSIGFPVAPVKEFGLPTAVYIGGEKYEVWSGSTGRVRPDGSPVLAVLSREHRQIYIDPKAIRESFAQKPWLHPKEEGVYPLAEGAIGTPNDWLEFNYRHAVLAGNNPRQPGESTAHYLNRINQLTLAEMSYFDRSFFSDTGISERTWDLVARSLNRQGVWSISDLSPGQQEALVDSVAAVQAAYDMIAFSAWASEDVRLFPIAAEMRYPPLPIVGYKWLKPFFRLVGQDRPEEKLQAFTAGAFGRTLDAAVTGALSGAHTGYPRLGDMQKYITLAVELVEQHDASVDALFGIYGITGAEAQGFRGVVKLHAVEGATRFITDSMLTRGFATEQAFLEALTARVRDEVAQARESCIMAKNTFQTHLEYVDRVLVGVTPYRPSSLLHKPKSHELADAITKFWQTKVRPELAAVLSEGVATRNLQLLAGPQEIALEVIYGIFKGLPSGAHITEWVDRARKIPQVGDRTSPGSYVEDVLAGLDKLVQSLIPVMATEQFPKYWLNPRTFLGEAKEIVRMIRKHATFAYFGTAPVPTIQSDVAQLVQDGFVLPHLERVLPNWAEEPNGWRLVERLTNRMLAISTHYSQTRSLIERLSDPGLDTNELVTTAQRLLRSFNEIPTFVGTLEKTLRAPHLPIPQPEMPDVVTLKWRGAILNNLAGKVFMGRRVPDTVVPKPGEKIEDFLARSTEAGWQAIRGWLVPEIVRTHGVLEGDAIEFLEFHRGGILGSIDFVVDTIRIARDRFWDPTGELHYAHPEETRRPSGRPVYRGTDHIRAYEIDTLTSLAMTEILAYLEPMERLFLGGEGTELPASTSPGFITLQEGRGLLEMFGAAAARKATGTINPAHPLASRLEALGSIRGQVQLAVEAHERLLQDRLALDPSMEGMEPWFDAVHNTFGIIGRSAARAWQDVESPISLYDAPPAIDIPSIYSHPRMPERFRLQPWGRLQLEEKIRATVARWQKTLLGSSVVGVPGQEYAVVLNTQDWTQLYPPIVGETAEMTRMRLAQIYDESKAEFAAKENLLTQLVRAIMYQIPITSDVEYQRNEYTAFALLTHHWERHLRARFEGRQPHFTFQESSIVDLSDPLTMSLRYREATRAIIGPEGPISSAQVTIGKALGIVEQQDFFDRSLVMWRRMWNDAVRGKRQLTEAEYLQLLVGLRENFQTELNRLSASFVATGRDSRLVEFARHVGNPEIPVETKLEWLSAALRRPADPGAGDIIAQAGAISFKAGLLSTPRDIEYALSRFQLLFQSVQKGLTGKSEDLRRADIRDFSWNYIERLYTQTVLVVESAFVDERILRGLIRPELLPWYDLLKLVWENRLVYPTDATHYQEVHSGFRNILSRARTDPTLVAFARMWGGVQGGLTEYVGLNPFAWFSLGVTSNLAQSALNTTYLDANGTPYTLEQAKERANYEMMLTLLQQAAAGNAGALGRFDALYQLNWVPFMYHDAMARRGITYFSERGRRLQTLREAVEKTPHLIPRCPVTGLPDIEAELFEDTETGRGAGGGGGGTW